MKLKDVGQPDGDESPLWKLGEGLATSHLERQGYLILERNWRAGRHGEVDIIAKAPEGIYVFAEVKTRRTRFESGNSVDVGFQAITGIKQHKIVRLALRFLSSRSLTTESVQCRFDVIVVHLPYLAWNDQSESIKQPEIIHVKDAFHAMSWS